MGYYEFNIAIANESRDALIQRASEVGCLGIVEKEKALLVYFHDTLGINTIKESLVSFRTTLRESGLDSTLSFEYVFISERDWNESWKKKFKPIDVGEIFFILPPWESKAPGRIHLIIDPGMAFGTGHHETTKTCLMLIEKLSRSIKKNTFLDIGTGTGILAIAAAKLGFQQITGVDIDPLAVDAAQRNIKLNDVQSIEIREGSIEAVDGAYDFIAANLMSEILIGMAPEMAPHLNNAGLALLSGMLLGQDDGVIAAMEKEGLKFLERFEDGRWVSLVLTR